MCETCEHIDSSASNHTPRSWMMVTGLTTDWLQHQSTAVLSCQHWAVNAWRHTRRRRQWCIPERQPQEHRRVVHCMPSENRWCCTSCHWKVSWTSSSHLTNTHGPRMDLCGTPNYSAMSSDTVFTVCTSCCQLLRNSAIQRRALPWTPNCHFRTFMRTEWSTVSKAANRSSRTKAPK